MKAKSTAKVLRELDHWARGRPGVRELETSLIQQQQKLEDIEKLILETRKEEIPLFWKPERRRSPAFTLQRLEGLQRQRLAEILDISLSHHRASRMIEDVKVSVQMIMPVPS